MDMDEEPNWKDELNIVYTDDDDNFIVHKMEDGNYQIINEKIRMGIVFNSAEWCCPVDNWVLFLDDIWTGFIVLPEDDDFFEALEEKRMANIEERAKASNRK